MLSLHICHNKSGKLFSIFRTVTSAAKLENCTKAEKAKNKQAYVSTIYPMIIYKLHL